MPDEKRNQIREKLSDTTEFDELQILSDNIPGGMFSCLIDKKLTLLQVNKGFQSMLGYTEDEISSVFDNSFWEMIDPRDREATMVEVQRQMAIGPDKVLEYRMRCKDGRTIWVLDKGHLVRDREGRECFCCVLVDVTRNKEIESELRISLERHQIIMNQTTDILFDWDIKDDKLILSGKWKEKFGRPCSAEGIRQNFETVLPVYNEDFDKFRGLISRILTGDHYAEEELRFVGADGHLVWCRVRISGLEDEGGVPGRAVGVIVDIDEDKKKAEFLIDRARRDTLTGLYNKGTSREYSEEWLSLASPEQKGALFIIDLDNFKHTNDTMGHLFGDALLSEVSHILQKQFRSRDIVGRVGGDEFMVFLKDITDVEFVKCKAGQIMSALSEMAVQDAVRMELSCSIGIAVFPDHGNTYQELYQRADQALYRAKNLGKNRYCFFEPFLPEEGFLPNPFCNVNTRIESDDNPVNVELRLIEYVFRILYKSSDMDVAVNTILEVLGRQFDVSRVYIFEDDEEDDRFCINTFEWCNEGIMPEIENLQHVRYMEDFNGGYKSNFDENGVFYCRDVSALPTQQREFLENQGIKSMLQCAIYDKGQYHGFVGFDECRVNRYWTQEQVSTIVLIAEILSTFLLKMRAQSSAINNAQSLETILDNQSAWIYVVRPDTLEMLYVNRRTQELVPQASAGITCHKAFYYSDTPCDFCPLKKLTGETVRSVRNIYNPYLEVWVSTDACYIEWKGDKAALITCHDVSDLMSK
ncbi:diguanylate cyclase [Blautia schinkii]|nr:diguanylate cyclase [Blautia schinkii]